ncbi:MAG: isopentenyl-diphosphate Delta-isomerase [Rhodothermales bacterium]|nr:isopentenyl-diphosphate Delta-isomerase [Rhodothermales bacterium]
MKNDRVILVDSNDREIGTEEKMAAHKTGVLHRAFSAFVIRDDGHMLLQRRADSKYHSAGLWSNTCCSHPRPGESVLDAAHRRMMEEMGMTVPLQKAFAFTYRAELQDELVEHEYDHVLIGRSNTTPEPAAEEVSDWRWEPPHRILSELSRKPAEYTVWFRIAFSRVLNHFSD